VRIRLPRASYHQAPAPIPQEAHPPAADEPSPSAEALADQTRRHAHVGGFSLGAGASGKIHDPILMRFQPPVD
jgi:hypothetical protein